MANTVKCNECNGTGRETVTDEITDDLGDIIATTESDYGPCEICDGTGQLAATTPKTHRDTLDAHYRRGAHSRSECPNGCVTALQMRRYYGADW